MAPRKISFNATFIIFQPLHTRWIQRRCCQSSLRRYGITFAGNIESVRYITRLYFLIINNSSSLNHTYMRISALYKLVCREDILITPSCMKTSDGAWKTKMVKCQTNFICWKSPDNWRKLHCFSCFSVETPCKHKMNDQFQEVWCGTFHYLIITT